MNFNIIFCVWRKPLRTIAYMLFCVIYYRKHLFFSLEHSILLIRRLFHNAKYNSETRTAFNVVVNTKKSSTIKVNLSFVISTNLSIVEIGGSDVLWKYKTIHWHTHEMVLLKRHLEGPNKMESLTYIFCWFSSLFRPAFSNMVKVKIYYSIQHEIHPLKAKREGGKKVRNIKKNFGKFITMFDFTFWTIQVFFFPKKTQIKTKCAWYCYYISFANIHIRPQKRR